MAERAGCRSRGKAALWPSTAAGRAAGTPRGAVLSVSSASSVPLA